MTPRASSDAAAGAPDAAEAFTPTLYDVVRDLRRDAAAVRLPLDLPGRADAEGARDRLLDQLDQHLLPRLKELSAPAVVVVAGSTGAGKSTLYNSLLGDDVSPAGVLRPTTREPVYAHHPADGEVIPDAPVTQASRVVVSDRVPRGVALLDAPDLDSLDDANREIAKRLLEAADLWLFVTTAARYGDALPWRTLELAIERGASVAMVLNRVPSESLVTIRGDLLERLRDHQMASTPLFVVPDLGPHEGLLDEPVVAPVRRWLTMLAGPERSRSVIVRTLQGSLDALPAWVARVAEAVEAQVAAAAEIRATVGAVVPEVTERARRAVLDGDLADGSVAAGWARVTHSKSSTVRIKNGTARSSARKGRAREAELLEVQGELEDSVRRTLVSDAGAVEDAVARALTGESAPPGGAELAPDGAEAGREGAREKDAARRAAEWIESGRSAAAEIGGERAAGAARAYGANGIGALLLLGAAGLDEATRTAERVLGPTVTDAVDALRTRLADETQQMIDVAVHDVLEATRGAEFEPAAASGLRLRRAELVRLTRFARAVRATPAGTGGVAAHRGGARDRLTRDGEGAA